MKTMQLAALAVVALLLGAMPALAQATSAPLFPGIGAGLGAGITIVGAGYGFGRIGAAALESMARQPEIAGSVQTGMIVVAALLEGATFFALVVCIIKT